MPSGAPVFDSKGVRTPASCRKERKPKTPNMKNMIFFGVMFVILLYINLFI